MTDAEMDAQDAADAAARTADPHGWDLQQQHGWGRCDHSCCAMCAEESDVVTTVGQCSWSA